MNTVSRCGVLLVAGLLAAGTASAQTSPSKQPTQEGDAQNLSNGSPGTFKAIEQGKYNTAPGTQFSGPGNAQKQPTQETDAQNLANGSPKTFKAIEQGKYNTAPGSLPK